MKEKSFIAKAKILENLCLAIFQPVQYLQVMPELTCVRHLSVALSTLLLASPANIGPYFRGFSGTNTLAYFDRAISDEDKSFFY